jgi:hypothetical protein
MGEPGSKISVAEIVQCGELHAEMNTTTSAIAGSMKRQKRGQSQLSAGRKTWLCKLPKLPPMLVPPPAAQIRPSTNADP